MTDTIQALRDEIEAALKASVHYRNMARRAQERDDYSKVLQHTARYTEMRAYMKGLQTAVRLLEQEPARDLPFTAENGEVTT